MVLSLSQDVVSSSTSMQISRSDFATGRFLLLFVGNDFVLYHLLFFVHVLEKEFSNNE